MLKPQKHIVWKKKNDMLVLLNTDSGHYYTLNPVASALWSELVSENGTVESAAHKISSSFSGSPSIEEIIANCAAIISEWKTENIITTS